MTWKAVRVILEYVVFLHDAIGVGLFVVMAHHVEKSLDCRGSCSPVNETMKMVNEAGKLVSLLEARSQHHKGKLLYLRGAACRWSRKSAWTFYSYTS